jgi:hypothetical protein
MGVGQIKPTNVPAHLPPEKRARYPHVLQTQTAVKSATGAGKLALDHRTG